MGRRTQPHEMRKATNDAVRIIAARMGISPDDVAVAAAPLGSAGGFVLDNVRDAAATAALDQYDFGPDAVIGEMDGWEHEIPGDEWTRKVYLEPDVQDIDEDSEAVCFTVRFASSSSTVVDAYAIDSRGNIFGSAAKAA